MIAFATHSAYFDSLPICKQVVSLVNVYSLTIVKALTIIGAGPAGLYAGFYAALRQISAVVIEESPVAGGQPAQLFGQKHVTDFPAVISCTGAELANRLEQQLLQMPSSSLLKNTKISEISVFPHSFLIRTNQGTIQAKALLLATGAGISLPTLVEIDCTQAEDRLQYVMDNLENYRNQRVIVLGGGDSAVD
ncbi:unnamed protein product [Didymodactylos carnosus]|uniref:FAD/NAD(P)-binding domain-containing protein n=1 Tax=Didymodactylos carnosus TaxID=1234261 RepID=A0A8S2GP43_9BILA|nr:unnamed protein product [Didymodactylos carnosus]CAF3523943.1 unnamed protein product [Didymodactylos carnosus]